VLSLHAANARAAPELQLAGARLAAEHGLLRPSLVVHDDLNARKLQARRIDAWLSSWNSIMAAQRNAGLPLDALRRGAVVSRVKIYLASSTDVQAERMKPWHAAFEAMLKDGSYRRLLKKYNFEEPAS
jgi:polar amino acid transport system substrate-binding protein